MSAPKDPYKAIVLAAVGLLGGAGGLRSYEAIHEPPPAKEAAEDHCQQSLDLIKDQLRELKADVRYQGEKIADISESVKALRREHYGPTDLAANQH